jgi:nitroreductase
MPVREPALAIWGSAIDEFPISGTTTEQLEALVPYAIQAPSSHNSQPWLFRVTNGLLELRADRRRRLPVVDPDDRELIISCGAALGNLEVALHNFGYEGSFELVPSASDPDLLARIGLGAQRDVTLMERALFAAIRIRRTHRLPFLPRTPEADLMSSLEAYGYQHGVWFRILQTDANRQAVAELVSEGDREQMMNSAFREELVSWLHPNRTRSRDGMPGWTFGMGELTSLTLPLVVRTFDTGAGRAAIDRDLTLGSPILAIIGSPSDTRHDWLQTGRVLTQVLLRAAVEGVAASYLNQPIEVPELRRRVGALLGTSGYPQLILRMGYPIGEDRRTPRRGVAEVVERIQ